MMRDCPLEKMQKHYYGQFLCRRNEEQLFKFQNMGREEKEGYFVF